MKRKIIEIDKERCVGCGLCVNSCHQGALQIIDGKAQLVGELLCDGLGACIAKCPQDALKIIEKEIQGKDEKMPCGCPGTMSQDFRGQKPQASGPVTAGSSTSLTTGPSQLSQWPVQLKLLNPLAPYFSDADGSGVLPQA
jgi:NAD-dependent dihydropyrimidine dehydrogenase PreA subunit